MDSAVLLTPRGFIRYASDASRECDAKSPQLKVESARRATVNRERQVRALPPELYAPVVETAMTPGPQPGSCGFESRRGY